MPSQQDSTSVRAVCVLRGADGSNISGTVHFAQMIGINQLKITGEFQGLPTDRKLTIHINEFGDLTHGAASTGNRFISEKKPSMASKDSFSQANEAGYLQVNVEGHAKLDFIDKRSTLFGPHSIIGRSVVVVDEKDDDLNRVESEDVKGSVSFPSNRLAAGVIGICQ